MKSSFLQKNSIAVINLAREIITMRVDDRLETITEYARKFDASRGTIQNAFKKLEEAHAIEVEAHGHLGSFLKDIDYKILWTFTDYGTILGVMPLPYSRIYEGLATGIYSAAKARNFEIGMAYMRGAEKRKDALLKGRYDFAVVSRLTADYYIRHGLDIEIVMSFGEHSYCREHALIFADNRNTRLEEGMTVAIDKSSVDQYLLTMQECEDTRVEFVNLPYNQILNNILDKKIDAAIWNIDEIRERNVNVNYYHLHNASGASDTEAVIITKHARDNGIAKVLQEYLEKDRIMEAQRKVMCGELEPLY